VDLEHEMMKENFCYCAVKKGQCSIICVLTPTHFGSSFCCSYTFSQTEWSIYPYQKQSDNNLFKLGTSPSQDQGTESIDHGKAIQELGSLVTAGTATQI